MKTKTNSQTQIANHLSAGGIALEQNGAITSAWYFATARQQIAGSRRLAGVINQPVDPSKAFTPADIAAHLADRRNRFGTTLSLLS